MDDRFIGYRGSQENEWSWEPGHAIRPPSEGTRGARKIALAALSAFAIVSAVLAAVYFIAGTGDEDGGAIVSVTATPTRRPTASPTASPTARPTVRPTPAPTTPKMTATPTPSPAPTPSPVPGTPRPGTEFFFWNERTGRWQGYDLNKGTSGISEGDVVLFLYKLSGLKPGETYEIDIDYFDCGLSPGQSFDYLASTASAGDGPQLAKRGPGRVRPDSQVPVPDDPGVRHDDGTTAYLSVWGGTFQQLPELTGITATCAGDKKLTIRVRAQSTTLFVEWGEHVATAADWPGAGAASAQSAFGTSVMLQGAGEERLEMLIGTISP